MRIVFDPNRTPVGQFLTWAMTPFSLSLAAFLCVLSFAPTALRLSAEEQKVVEHGATVTVETHAFRLNTVGYTPISPKLASVVGTSRPFRVVRVSDGESVLQGESSCLLVNQDTNEELSIIDFTEVEAPGTYRLEVEGVGSSSEFQIAPDVYNFAFYTVTRGMYLWRCGMTVSGWHGGETFSHEACHLQDGFTDFIGHSGGTKNGVGGWHDAGDYNKYVVNAGVTVGMMLQAWEHFPERLRSLTLDLPESATEMPDYLAELRWEIDWVLKTQLGDGSVSHKLSTEKFGGFIAPEDESAQRFFTPWGSAATADFVAMTAAAARVFKPYDEQYADKCLLAAERSYQFLKEHPEDHRADLKGFSTGSYQTEDADGRLWAAAEMWQTTGEASYLYDFEERVRAAADRAGPDGLVIDFDWDWTDVSNLGMFTYVLSDRPGRAEQVVSRVKKDLVAVADEIVATAAAHGYARPLGNRYYWGCNGTVARLAMVLEVADRLKPNPRYQETILAALNHLFGRNFYGRSFVTGLGFSPPLFPHDRRNGLGGVTQPWPGYLVGGGWPTARDWKDAEESYQTNEIAINWNGALIYALARFVEPDSFDRIRTSSE